MSVNVASDRCLNFSAGPAAIPLSVLERVQRELVVAPGCGASILEISHRSPQFKEILADTEQRLRDLLEIPADYRVLFLQGGARLQFSMVPMNLLGGDTKRTAAYLLTGSWGKKAVDQAKKVGRTEIVWDGTATNYDRLPGDDEWTCDPAAAYLHITTNETIQGVQFADDPTLADVPLVCDASSDLLFRPVRVSQYGLIYACAQKNAGPAGVTLVIIREDLLERSQDALPGYLNYSEHVKEKSLYNTPPTFGIYVMGLVARWLQEEVGGLAQMHRRNIDKAQLLYEVIDESPEFYQGHARADSRSLMNVTFRLPSDALQTEFLAEAAHRNMHGLAGHRSVGGIRASIYNAMPHASVEMLRELMLDFRDRKAT